MTFILSFSYSNCYFFMLNTKSVMKRGFLFNLNFFHITGFGRGCFKMTSLRSCERTFVEFFLIKFSQNKFSTHIYTLLKSIQSSLGLGVNLPSVHSTLWKFSTSWKFSQDMVYIFILVGVFN